MMKQIMFGLQIPFLAAAAAGISLFGILAVAVYRVYFHPLSKYPGPRLAAATGGYRVYYDLWKGGQMVHQLEALHKQYGPIVRFAPNELHFSEPSAYLEIYNNNKLVKDPFMYKSFDEDEAAFGYCDPHLSRRRRDLLNTLFSRRSILSVLGLINTKVDKLCEKFANQYAGQEKAVDISFAFRSATMDIITMFCFAECVDSLDWEGFRHPLVVSVESSLPIFWVFKHFPLAKWMILNSPPWFSAMLGLEPAGIIQIQEVLAKQLDKFLADPGALQDVPHPIIYHKLLDKDAKGASGVIPSRKSLFDEAQSLLYAGSETLGNTLSVGMFHILSNPEVYKNLVDELLANWPTLHEPPAYEELEKLPYLTAVIKESLRLSYGTVSPMPRIVPSSGATIGGVVIPGGTVVACATPFVHTNEVIFPNSSSFIPERWLQPDSKNLDRWLVSFSRGPRQCIGINLAYCELYILLSNIVRRFDMDLHDTTKEDLEWREYFVPHYSYKHIQTIVRCRST